jgi:hypothetical protein
MKGVESVASQWVQGREQSLEIHTGYSFQYNWIFVAKAFTLFGRGKGIGGCEDFGVALEMAAGNLEETVLDLTTRSVFLRR